MRWHYSHAMPIGKLVTYGAWEAGAFVGAVIFGRGASPALGKPFGLDQTAVCELVRVALTTHASPVTQIVARALRQLKASNPGMRLVVSFADPNVGHRGGIYQAGGWVYTGCSPASDEVLFDGKWVHTRMLRPTGWGTTPRIARLSDERKAQLPRRRRLGKHRYVMPLDRAMRRQVAALALPYPRGRGLDGEPAGLPPDSAGSTPADRSEPLDGERART